MARKKRHKEFTSHAKGPDGNRVEPIDYEKLAKCIAKAIADENDKRINAHSATREWMKYIIFPVFVLIALLATVLFIWCFMYGISAFNAEDFSTNLKGVLSLIFALILVAVSFWALMAAKEFDKEKDKQFVASVFSGMVAFVALIVAFVTFLMEVR